MVIQGNLLFHMDARQFLLNCYRHGLDAVNGRSAVRQALMASMWDMCHVVAVGKAAESMMLGALDALGSRIKSAYVVSKDAHFSGALRTFSHIHCVESAHPVPDMRSLAAGQGLLAYLQALPSDVPLLVLVSGGASSLVEVLPDDWDLVRLQSVTQQLLANGSSIAEINTVRRKISNIKGGKLWHAIGQRPVSCLLISDVPNDEPAVIGSGLLFPAPDKVDFEWRIVASNTSLLIALSQYASAIYPTQVMPVFLQGDTEATAHQCVTQLRALPRGVYMWGAETTVVLPDNPQRGGRNQHLALTAAMLLKSDDTISLLVAGTDGTDGMSEDAGAIVDQGTIIRGTAENLDAKQCLSAANSGTFLAASGDLLNTGATGTNVMDVIIGLKA